MVDGAGRLAGSPLGEKLLPLAPVRGGRGRGGELRRGQGLVAEIGGPDGVLRKVGSLRRHGLHFLVKLVLVGSGK